MTDDVLNFLGDLVRAARAGGADEADAVDIDSRSLEAAVRFGKIEHVERSEQRKTGLRVLVGRRQAVVASADRRPETAASLVERAVAMARAAPEDPYAGLAEPGLLAAGWPDLDLYDAAAPTSEYLVRRASEAEAAALDVLCEGRLRLGVAVGWNHVEFEALGMDFSDRGRRIAEQIAVNSPQAIRLTKELARRGRDMSLADGLRLYQEYQRLAFSSDDAREGTRAFAERRDPQYRG